MSTALVQAPGAPGALVQVTALACSAAAVLEALREAGLAAAVPNASPGPDALDPGGVPASRRLAGAAEAVQAALGVLEAALAAAGAAEVAALPELGACVIASGVPGMLKVGRRLLHLQPHQSACLNCMLGIPLQLVCECSRRSTTGAQLSTTFHKFYGSDWPGTHWTAHPCLWLRCACAQPGSGRSP